MYIDILHSEFTDIIKNNTKKVCLQPSTLKKRYKPTISRNIFTKVLEDYLGFSYGIIIFLQEDNRWIRNMFLIDGNYNIKEEYISNARKIRENKNF